MSKATKRLSAILFVILLLELGFLAALRLPYLRARCAMPHDAAPALFEQTDGTLRLCWDAAPEADDYTVRVLTRAPGDAAPRCLFSAVCPANECVLPAALPSDQPVEIEIGARRAYRALGKTCVRRGDDPVSLGGELSRTHLGGLTVTVDPASRRARFDWTGRTGDVYRLYRLLPDGSRSLLTEQDHTGAVFDFGGADGLPLPSGGETLTFALEGSRRSGGVIIHGAAAETVTLRREDFLDRALAAAVTDEGENRFTLTWNETGVRGYSVREIDPVTGEARLLAEMDSGVREYRTGRLRACTAYCFEIAPLDGGDSVAPARVELKTSPCPVYAAVWAMADTPIYAAPDGKDQIGVMHADRAWCVLAESGGWFQVGSPELTGYVDSGKCMIDLPDYIGDLCSYDVTNAYSSLYMVHEFAIPAVTGTVVEGYENVELSPEGALVPLLYPAAKKLIAAAEAMAPDGLRIRIYDSFRPNRATCSIYSLTEKVMHDPIPAAPYNGVRPADMPAGELTYAELMTNATWGLSSFLAQGGSMHNLGVAMDLTLERASDRSALPMQTSIHDLSWYSNIYRNNANASLLRQYMTGAGFGGLTSEWWHFQDNEAVSAHSPANRWAGVTPEGWRRDDIGWRYRLSDGAYCVSAERSIDGSVYRFDENGYLVP